MVSFVCVWRGKVVFVFCALLYRGMICLCQWRWCCGCAGCFVAEDWSWKSSRNGCWMCHCPSACITIAPGCCKLSCPASVSVLLLSLLSRTPVNPAQVINMYRINSSLSFCVSYHLYFVWGTEPSLKALKYAIISYFVYNKCLCPLSSSESCVAADAWEI